jgi:5-methylcytosine-specific restriction endonuclease McrA
MTYANDRLRRIFEKTDGHCFHCGKKLAWNNYGNPNSRTGWEVDHSIPRSKGGTDHLNNLFPSCIPCNRDKGDLSSKQYRAKVGNDSTKSEDNLLSVIIAIGGLLLLLGWINRIKHASRTSSYYS